MLITDFLGNEEKEADRESTSARNHPPSSPFRYLVISRHYRPVYVESYDTQRYFIYGHTADVRTEQLF